MKLRLSLFPFLGICCIAILGLNSCGDIEQDLQLNANGSGVLETSFNVGDMMSMVKGMGNVTNEDVTISSDEAPDTTNATPETPKDPMQAIIDKVTDPGYGRDFDTLITFMSVMPDSVKEKQTRKDLVEKLSIHMKSPANSSDLTIGVIMNFDSPAQLKELVAYLQNMDNTNSSSVMSNVGPSGLQNQSFLLFDIDMKAGWIRFDTVDYSGMASEFGMTPDSLMSSEDMGMMEMMFGNSKIKSVIHVPGEVISCTNKEAILTKDNKVIVEYGLMDAIKKGKMDGYTILFTPKK